MSISKNDDFSSSSSRKSIDFEDDITYEDFVQEDFPSDIVFPQTLNHYLGRKLQEITSENGCLRKALQDAEEKLQISKTSPFYKIANEKKSTIDPLSRIYKEQVVEVEFSNSKYISSNGEKVSREGQLNNRKYKNNKNTKGLIFPSRRDINNLEDELLKKDIQIETLNEKLNQAKVNLSLNSGIDKIQKVLPHRCSCRKSSSVSLDSKVATNLRNLEKERRQQIENSAKELKQTEITLENTKRKLDAAKARIKVLENELCVAKRNVILLNEKKCHDDQLIEALNGQLKVIELRFLDREIEIQNQKGKFEREFAAVKNELESVQVQNNQLRKKLEEQER